MDDLLSAGIAAHPSERFSLSGTQNKPNSQPLTISDRIAAYVVNAKFEDLPPPVVQKAKEQIVYHLGLAFEGWFTEEARKMRAVVQNNRQTRGATVIGERLRLSPPDAAFANSTLMRATWRDDVIWPAGIHAGIVTLPTALALGEVRRVSGREMLLALVLGYEVLGKLGTAADGWTAKLPRRPTMIYGGYGPVVVGGRLLKLGLKNMAHALGYAANVGMGVPEGGQTEHYYGLISRGGTLAVQLAEAGGIAYSNETIEGETGLYRSFFGKVPAELPTLIGQLGSDWEILKAAQKRYPGTGQNTVAIELLLGLLKAEKLTAKQVSRVDVFQSAVDDSKERKKEVSSRGPFAKAGEAYSSLPYALALVLLEGKVAGERYENEGIVNDATVAATMQKINLAFENGHDSMRWSRIEVSTTDGRKLTREADNFSFPFPREAWGEWLQKDGKRLLPKGKLRRLEDMVGALEKVEDVSEMLALLAPV